MAAGNYGRTSPGAAYGPNRASPRHSSEPARDFAQRPAHPLAVRPTWLFSSGPLGSTHPTPDGEPADVAAMLELTGAEEHRLFVGRLDMAGLSFGEKAIVRALDAPVGDFRDWSAIDAYAREIALRLCAHRSVEATDRAG